MKKNRWLAWILLAALTLAPAASLADDSVVLSCWVYYNGKQEQLFGTMVQEFNDTVGAESGIFVEYQSKSSISELDAQVRASALNEPGAETLPDLYAAYADTTYAMRSLGVVADLSPYMTESDLAEYIDAYVEEGRFGEAGEWCIFPAAKATELLLLNQTQWDAFAAATGAEESELQTWEGLVRLAESYYAWTDGLTPAADDGQAFFGRDSMANYLLIGSMQLGHEVFQVSGDNVTLDFDETTLRKLWDCYYVPYVNGWYTAEGRFRSDDIKTGKIAALVGSTSGAVYFPSEVTFDDGTSQAIEASVRALPNFAGTEPYAVQQGAGFVVTRSTPEREKAAVSFLRWFTEPERNLKFAVGSGYLPVTKAANRAETTAKVMEEIGAKPMLRSIIQVGAEISTSYRLYTNRPFANGYEARSILETTLSAAAQAACVERDQLVAGGLSRQEAAAQLTTDEAFAAWYTDTKTALEKAIASNE